MKYKKCIKIVAVVIAVMIICVPALDCYAWSFDNLTGKGKEVADTSSDMFSQLDNELPDSFLKKIEDSWYDVDCPSSNLGICYYRGMMSNDKVGDIPFTFRYAFYNAGSDGTNDADIDVNLNYDICAVLSVTEKNSRYYLKIDLYSKARFYYEYRVYRKCSGMSGSSIDVSDVGAASSYAKYDDTINLYHASFDTGSGYYGYLCDESGSIIKNLSTLKFLRMPMPVLSNQDAAVEYLKDGKLDGAEYVPGGNYSYDENLYLKNINMTIYDSNLYSKYYVHFSYDLPDSIKLASDFQKGNYKIKICNTLQWEGVASGSTDILFFSTQNNSFKDYRSGVYYDYIDLADNPFGFDLYLDDLSSVYSFVNIWNGAFSDAYKKQLLGSSARFYIDSVDISGVLSYQPDYLEPDISRVDLQFALIHNDMSVGCVYSGRIDLLSSDGYLDTYEPDTVGDYVKTDEKDIKDHYYTDVGTDSAGNTTYNYYYYGTDGSKTRVDSSGDVIVSTGSVTQNNNVSIPDNINVTVNSSSGGSSLPDVTIEDDDLSFNSLVDVLRSGFGLIDNIDTETKGDGYPAMMKDLFSYLPDIFSNLPILGCSSVIGIAIIRALIKR